MSVKVEVEVQVQDLPKVEKTIPVLANSIPLGGYKGQALVKKSNEHYDVEWKTIEGGEGGGSGYTEEELKAIIEQETKHLQSSTDTRLETQSKDIVGAINELNAREDKEGLSKEQVEEIVDKKISAIDYEPYQTKVDETLTTNDKTIVGAINELNAKEDKVGLSKEEVESVVDEKIVDLQSAEQVEKSINDAVLPIQNAISTQNNKIAENTYGIEGLQNSLSNYALLTGGNIFSGQQVFSGNIVVQGSIVQQGMAYETHTQQLYTFNDYIILRDGAITGLTAGEYTGFTARLYDGVNDGRLVFDNTGTARVGDVGFEQPLATRSEATDFHNKHLVMWDETNQKLVDAGRTIEKIENIAKLYRHRIGLGLFLDGSEYLVYTSFVSKRNTQYTKEAFIAEYASSTNPTEFHLMGENPQNAAIDVFASNLVLKSDGYYASAYIRDNTNGNMAKISGVPTITYLVSSPPVELLDNI